MAFVFGRKLQSELLVPVGLMNAAVAGTGIDGWQYVAPGEPPIKTKYQNNIPKIEPLVGHAMRGTLWYQGEANVKDGQGYLPKMKRLIEGWRGVWKQGDFPFYFVQLASMGESPTDKPEGGDGRAGICNAQLEALAIPNTGMAVAIDIGGRREHPKKNMTSACGWRAGRCTRTTVVRTWCRVVRSIAAVRSRAAPSGSNSNMRSTA